MLKIKNAVIKYIKSADLILLLIALVISAVGMLMIYSTTRTLGTNRYILVQGLGIAVGGVGFIIMSLIDLRRFPRLWVALFIFNILFQLSLKFLGVAGDTGNKSWIPIGSTGLNIQPGEVGKIIFIYTLSSHIHALKGKINSPFSILQLVAHMGITAASVFLVSRDMGVTLMYPMIFIIMLFVSGISPLWVGGMTAAGVGMVPVMWPFISLNQQQRILVVFDPDISPKFAWHAKLSMAALRRGQLLGRGYMNGTHFVNRHNDFIFAALGEEFGFVGCIVLIVLLTLLVFRIFYDSTKSDDLFGRLLCVGIGGMLMIQILINIGMCAGVMPVIGLTLPLVSYGGTSVMTTIASLGLVSGITMRRRPEWLRTSANNT